MQFCASVQCTKAKLVNDPINMWSIAFIYKRNTANKKFLFFFLRI